MLLREADTGEIYLLILFLGGGWWSHGRPSSFLVKGPNETKQEFWPIADPIATENDIKRSEGPRGLLKKNLSGQQDSQLTFHFDAF